MHTGIGASSTGALQSRAKAPPECLGERAGNSCLARLHGKAVKGRTVIGQPEHDADQILALISASTGVRPGLERPGLDTLPV